jgi:hypothetical protein
MRVFIPLLMVLILAAPASAQEAYKQEAYKQVWVTQSDSGEVLRGRMLRLSGETLALLTPDNRRVEVPLDHVLRIDIHGDSLKNGATIGAVVMGVLGGIGCLAVERANQCVTGIVLNTALGGVIGAGIDAANGGRTTIYTKPAAATPAVMPGPRAPVQFRVRF